MAISYLVGLDRDNDGVIDWGDPDDNLSNRVIALEWRLGMARPYDDYPALTTARITLRNSDQRFSPEYNPDVFQVGQMLHILSNDGLTERRHFTGHLSQVQPRPGDHGERTAVLLAVGVDAQLAGQQVRLPPQINQRADSVIAALLDAVPLRRQVLQNRWVLGRSGFGELDTHTNLPDITVPRTLETGKSVFSYIGDTWAEGIPASAALASVTAAERGRLFIDREGVVNFYNRHHLLLDSASTAAFTDDMLALTYDYGAEVVSQVRVRLIPRYVGQPQSVLWASESPQLIAAGSVRRMTVYYQDTQKRPVGALNVLPPRRGVDYQANMLADGQGSDQTAVVGIFVIEASFSAATLEIRNTGPRSVYLLPGFQLLGQPLYQGDPVVVDMLDHEAQVFYGPRTFELNLPLLDALEQGDQVARFELARRQKVAGIVRSITLSAAHQPTQALARTLFDRITISETQTGHTADYFIIAEAHAVTQGGLRHTVTWTLESALANTFWLLNQSRLDVSTILVY